MFSTFTQELPIEYRCLLFMCKKPSKVTFEGFQDDRYGVIFVAYHFLVDVS